MVVTHSQETCASFLRKFLASNLHASSCKLLYKKPCQTVKFLVQVSGTSFLTVCRHH